MSFSKNLKRSVILTDAETFSCSKLRLDRAQVERNADMLLLVKGQYSQIAIATILGLAVVCASTVLSRRGLLSFRYTLGWYAIGGLGVISSFFIPLVEPFASFLYLSGAGLLAGLAIVLFLSISIQLTISISGLQKQVHILAEELARLKHSIDSDA